MTTLFEIAETVIRNHKGNLKKALPKFMQAMQPKQLEELGMMYLQYVQAQVSKRAQPSVYVIPPSKGSVKVNEYNVPKHRRRTPEEKEAAKIAMLTTADAIFETRIAGRRIGDFAMGELVRLKHDLVLLAASNIKLGAEQVRDAIIAEKIEQHCVVPDQLMHVRDAIDSKTLARLMREAEKEVPMRIEIAMRMAADVMEHPEEQVSGLLQ